MNYKTWVINFIEGFHNLKGTKQRSFLGLLGVVIGTGSVIMLINVAGIVKNQILQQFQSMGTNVFSVTMQSTGRSAQDNTGFDLKKNTMILKKNKNITQLIPVQMLNVSAELPTHSALIPSDESMYYTVIATVPLLFEILKMEVAQGRFLSSLDNNEYYTFAGGSYDKKSHLGLNSVVKMGNEGLSVIGIAKNISENLLLFFDPNSSFYVTQNVAKTLVKNYKVNNLLGTVIHDSLVEEATEKLKKDLEAMYPDSRMEMRTAKTIIDQAQKQAELLGILLIAIGSIALVVGGIGVMNVMLVSVAQRKSEIGLRIALGATVNDIKMLFLSESVTLCFVGGVLGTLIGIGVSFFFAFHMEMPFIVSWVAIPSGFFISVLSGVLSGVYPASQAAKMNPIEALRTE